MYSTVQLNKFMTLSISLKQTIITTLVNKSTCTLFLVGCEKFFQKKKCVNILVFSKWTDKIWMIDKGIFIHSSYSLYYFKEIFAPLKHG